jgi:hypothetical protein
MDDRLDCEARLAAHNRKTAEVDAHGWKTARPVGRYRTTLAQLLIAAATRLAPTVSIPPIVKPVITP